MSRKERTQADMLIVATAQAHQLALVTRNLRNFEGCGGPLAGSLADRGPPARVTG